MADSGAGIHHAIRAVVRRGPCNPNHGPKGQDCGIGGHDAGRDPGTGRRHAPRAVRCGGKGLGLSCGGRRASRCGGWRRPAGAGRQRQEPDPHSGTRQVPSHVASCMGSLSLESCVHLRRDRSYAFNRSFEPIAWLHGTNTLRRAGVNQIARPQVVVLRQVRDDRRDVVNQL